MANFNNPTEHGSQHLSLLGELNFDGLNGMKANSSKDMPPMNPLAVTSGMYIPLEETQQMQHNDDVMNWGMSDDQQDSDDEMDGNEFDLDFDDAEFLPPLNYPTQSINTQNPDVQYSSCQQPSMTTFNVDQTPYTNQYHHPFNTRYNMQQQLHPQQLPLQETAYNDPQISNDPLLTAYNQPSHAPLEFINPSRLQLPQEEQDLDFLSPSNELSSSLYGGIDVDDLNLDMEFEDLYPMLGREDGSVDSQHQLPSEPSDLKPEPFMTQHVPTPPAEVQPIHQDVQRSLQHSMPPPPQQQSTTDPYNHPQFQSTPPAEAVSLPSPVSSVSSPAEKKPQSRRKTRTSKYVSSDDDSEYDNSPPSRRKGRKSSPQATASSAHVCDKVYPDGTQCRRSFTRPYDLARHQETLHASVRKTFRCQVCGNDSKTFSRLDALSRHMRLKHPSD